MAQHVIDKFLGFENKHKLYNKQILGFHYWNYIRFELYSNIICKEHSYDNFLKIKKAPQDNKKHIIKNLIINLLKNPLFIRTKKDILILNSPRRVKKGKYYICPYTERILRHLQYSYYVIEVPYYLYNNHHFEPVPTKNLWYMDGINCLVGWELRYLKTTQVPKNLKAEIKNIIKALNAEFEMNFEVNKLISHITYYFNRYIIMKKYIRFILKKIKPKCVIEVNAYSFENMVITEVAKELGIKTIELQHGVIGKYHIAYNYYNKPKIKNFVDYIFVFGDYWKNATRFPINQQRIFTVGYPEFEKEVCNKKKKKDTYKKVILFLSDALFYKEFSALALDLFNKIDHEKYEIIFKLHPIEYGIAKRRYSQLYSSDIKVIDNNSHDLYYYLSHADYQVGMCSTAIYEGVGFGLKTFIVNRKGHEIMEDLIKENYAYLIDNSEDIICYLNKENTTSNLWNNYTEYFWESNSINKINTILKEIIRN